MVLENKGSGVEPKAMDEKWIEEALMASDMWQFIRDAEYMRLFYPPMAREILGYVSIVCDRAEYEGSLIYDQYPDRVGFLKMADDVYQMASYMDNMFRPVLEEDEEIDPQGHCVSCRGTQSWLKNLIDVILAGELVYRRYRYFTGKNISQSPAWR